jgi:hypothetical protein
MGISTSNASSNSKPAFNRKHATLDLLKHQQWIFDRLSIENPVYIPKCAYRPYGKQELHIAFFESEVAKAEDIYTEFVSITLESEDPERVLYKWKHNPFYKEEYDTTEPNSQGHVRYLIPVSELITIKPEKIITEKRNPENKDLFPDFDDMLDPDTDAPLSAMTVRDLAAIMLKKPVSNKKWLNNLIQK